VGAVADKLKDGPFGPEKEGRGRLRQAQRSQKAQVALFSHIEEDGPFISPNHRIAQVVVSAQANA
jgi:hypothetical protein